MSAPFEYSHLITKISAVIKMGSEASSSQSSTPKAALVIRFEVNRSPTAATASAVKTTPVAMMIGPLVFRPRIVFMMVQTRCREDVSGLLRKEESLNNHSIPS